MGWGEGTPIEGPEGQPHGVFYKYSNSIEKSDPGSGYLRFNKGSLAESPTELFISETDADGGAASATLAMWDADFKENPLHKGSLMITNEAMSAFFLCEFEKEQTDNGTWRNVEIKKWTSSGNFTNGERLLVDFYVAGIKKITADLLEVSEISAISENLGVIVSGVLHGAIIDLDQGSASENKISWFDETGEAAYIANPVVAETSTFVHATNLLSTAPAGAVRLQALDGEGVEASLSVVSDERAGEKEVFTKGPASAGATAETETGGPAWSNRENAKSLDGVAATCSFEGEQTSDRLSLTKYSLSVPGGATIKGIEVQVTGKGIGTADSYVKLTREGSLVGDNKSLAAEYPGTYATHTFGGSEDLWGTTWTVAQVNAETFGVGYQGKNLGLGSATLYIDAIRVIVYYTTEVLLSNPHEVKAQAGSASAVVIDSDAKATLLQLSGRRKERDFGIVEALPAEPVKGDRCKYKAAAGIYWDLVYTEEATYPWAVIGGPLLLDSDNTSREQNTNTAWQQLTEPLLLTLPLAGEYDITVAGGIGSPATAAAARVARIGYKMGSTSAENDWAAAVITEGTTFAARGVADVMKLTRWTAAKNAEVKEYVKCDGNYTQTFGRRRLWAMPVRVG